MRVAVAGFQHETNTFAPGRTEIWDFERADSWPALLRGGQLIEETRGLNLPIAGAVVAAQEMGAEVVPLLWCAAEPGGVVAETAFERIAAKLVGGIRAAGPLDGVYLDLHGAMVVQSAADGEAALLERLRSAFGDLRIAVSLDLHANISDELCGLADVMTVYRTYPHLDMAQTGARAMQRLLDGHTYFHAHRKVPFLVPLHAQFTGAPPWDALYAQVAADDHCAGFWELGLGFTASDVRDCGVSVVAYGLTQSEADLVADRAKAFVLAQEALVECRLMPAAEALKEHLPKLARSAGPLIMADVQDNPGAGGSGDTTGCLKALAMHGQGKMLLAVLADASLAARAHDAGVGAVLDGALGAEGLFVGRFEVLVLSNGNIRYTGAMYGGGVAQIGPSCLVRVLDVPGDLRVVVSSHRTQCLDRAFFTAFGEDPATADIVCVKSTVHYRDAFDPIAGAVVSVAEPGLFACDLTQVPYRNLRAGVRICGGDVLNARK